MYVKINSIHFYTPIYMFGKKKYMRLILRKYYLNYMILSVLNASKFNLFADEVHRKRCGMRCA